MSLGLPAQPEHPGMILAAVQDTIDRADPVLIRRIEERLHDRLRILRERELPADEIREALALCHARRTQLSAPSAQPLPADPGPFGFGI